MSKLPQKPYEYGSPFQAVEALDKALEAVERLFDAKLAAVTDILAGVKNDVDSTIKRLDALEKADETVKKAGKASGKKTAGKES